MTRSGVMRAMPEHDKALAAVRRLVRAAGATPDDRSTQHRRARCRRSGTRQATRQMLSCAARGRRQGRRLGRQDAGAAAVDASWGRRLGRWAAAGDAAVAAGPPPGTPPDAAWDAGTPPGTAWHGCARSAPRLMRRHSSEHRPQFYRAGLPIQRGLPPAVATNVAGAFEDERRRLRFTADCASSAGAAVHRRRASA